MLEKLIQIAEQRKQLEISLKKRRSDFEDSLALEQAQYDDLCGIENGLREEAILKLEKENKTSEKVGNKTVIKQIKRTLRIIDAFKLRENIINDIKPSDYGYKKEEIRNSFEDTVLVKDKNIVNGLIDAYEKVEGKLLNGVEAQETKFILIK
jgi:hypothetical protein